MLSRIDTLLHAWGDWIASYIEGTPQAPHASPIVRFGLPSSRAALPPVPAALMPPAVARIDRALRDAPSALQAVAHQHYVERVKPDAKTRRRFYEALDRLHWWVHGYLCAQPDGGEWVENQ